MDRLSRSLKDLWLTLEKIENMGTDFHSITENIDTSTPAGRIMIQIVGSFAEFERAMLRERTKIGLATVRLDGPQINATETTRDCLARHIGAENRY